MSKDKEQGLTLTEVLVVVILSAITGTILVSFLVQNNRLFFQQTARVSQGLSVNRANQQISEAIKSASAVATACSPPACNAQYLSKSSQLVVMIPSIAASGEVIENTADFLVITADSSQPAILRKLVFPNPLSSRKSENQVLATKLSQLEFIYLDSTGNQVSPNAASRINFTINLLEKAGFGDETSSVSGQVNLRNN